MSFEQVLFYIFSAIIVLSAFRVVTTPNPVHAALYMVLSFFTTALVWLLLEAEFLGIVLILVYVGAVMVLFLFVVMMLDINFTPLREGFIKFLPVGAFIALLMIAEMGLVAWSFFGEDRYGITMAKPADYSNTQELGEVIYTEYVYAFEIAAVILLVAIIASITLTLRRREGVKYQNIAKQVSVRREDRVRLVKMDADEQ